jgi:hypothetical protein
MVRKNVLTTSLPGANSSRRDWFGGFTPSSICPIEWRERREEKNVGDRLDAMDTHTTIF